MVDSKTRRLAPANILQTHDVVTVRAIDLQQYKVSLIFYTLFLLLYTQLTWVQKQIYRNDLAKTKLQFKELFKLLARFMESSWFNAFLFGVQFVSSEVSTKLVLSPDTVHGIECRYPRLCQNLSKILQTLFKVTIQEF